MNGNGGADNFTVDNVSMTGGDIYVVGGNGNANVSVKNIDKTGGYVSIDMSGGKDSLPSGNDTISVENISNGYRAYFDVYARNGNDSISIKNSTTNGYLNTFGGAVNATLTDLSTSDVISLRGDYSQAYYKSDKNILIYGTGVKVSLGGVSDVSTLSNVKIYNGSTQKTFGNFVTVLEWKLEKGVASYGDLITISGLSNSASWSNITVDGRAINTMDEEEILASGKPVVISNNALDTSKVVEITSGYTLTLGADVTDLPEDIPEHWEISAGNAVYLATGSSAGYVLSDNQIYYQSEMPGSAIVKVTGLSNSATTSDISLNKKVVTVKNHALDSSKTVEISSGVASYNTACATEGYILADNKISHIAEIAAETLVTVSGLKTTAKVSQLSLSGNTVTVAQAATTKGTLTISDGYALNLAKGTYSKVSVVGSSNADTIYTSGGSALISVGAGNDSITATKGSNVYQYASGDGNDTISGFTAKDTLNISSGEIDSWTISDKDLTLNVGSGSIKIANGAGASISVLESDSKKAETFIYGENIKYNVKKTAATLAADFESAYTAEKTVVSIDGAATDSIQITGNSQFDYRRRKFHPLGRQRQRYTYRRRRRKYLHFQRR